MGWVEVAIAYVILSGLAILLFTTPKIKVLIKVLMIPFIIWFSVALYYGANSLKGHPVNGDPPYGSIIVGAHVVEKNFMSDNPAIFLTVVYPSAYEIGKGIHPLDPRVAFLYFKKGDPVLYKILYDPDLVKRLREAMEKSRDIGGLMMWSKKKGKGSDNPYIDDSGIKILNPSEVLKKEGIE